MRNKLILVVLIIIVLIIYFWFFYDNTKDNSNILYEKYGILKDKKITVLDNGNKKDIIAKDFELNKDNNLIVVSETGEKYLFVE